MVRVYGMSSLGPIQYADPSGNVFLGRDYNKGSDYSAGVATEIDKEVRSIVDSCHDQCKQILTEQRALLDLIASQLYEHETLTNEEITNLKNFGQLTDPNISEEQLNDQNEMPPLPMPNQDVPAPTVDNEPPVQNPTVDHETMDEALNELTKK